MPSSFFGTSSASSTPSSQAPISLKGFNVPSSTSQPGSTPSFSIPSSAAGYVDPSMLFSGSPFSGFGSAGQQHGNHGGFSDLDLDFEATLASLALPHQQQQQQASSQAQGSVNAQHHAFPHSLQAQQQLGGAGSNGFLGSTPLPGSVTSQQQQQQTDFAALSSAGGGPSSFGGMRPPPGPSSLPHYLAQSSTSLSRPGIPAFASSPRSPMPQELFSPGSNVDSPLGGESAQFGSYSSVGESFSPAPSAQTPAAGARSSSKSRINGQAPSPPDASRSRSAGVGKAPTSANRSRSARRSGASAIVIPSSSASQQSGSHQLAMSMPAYPAGGHGPTSVGSSTSQAGQWFASAAAISQFGSQTASPSLASSVGTSKADMDPQTGWRPTQHAVPSSAPAAPISRRTKTLPDVMEHHDDEGEGGEGAGGGNDPDSKAALLTEKRRKRRESHNAVERRRRDNINDRITELSQLLPECLLEQVTKGGDDDENPAAPGTPLSLAAMVLSPTQSTVGLPNLSGMAAGPAPSQGAVAQAAAAGKPNKGMILAKSVEYIRFLQQLVELHTQRNAELEQLVHQLRETSMSTGGGAPQATNDASFAAAYAHLFPDASNPNSVNGGSGHNSDQQPSPNAQHHHQQQQHNPNGHNHFGLHLGQPADHHGLHIDPTAFAEQFMREHGQQQQHQTGHTPSDHDWASMLSPQPKQEDMDES